MQDEMNYEIRLDNNLDEKWSAYFQPFTVTPCGNLTILCGSVHDQAELFGILLKIRDLGLKLVSVNPVLRL